MVLRSVRYCWTLRVLPRRHARRSRQAHDPGAEGPQRAVEANGEHRGLLPRHREPAALRAKWKSGWGKPFGLKGGTGAAGATTLAGAVPLASGEGVDGGFYIDTATAMLYGPKDGSLGSGTPLTSDTSIALAQLPTSVQNTATIVYDVRDYDAAGDGTTDDTQAIQAALDAAAVNGGTVFCRTGTYLISAALTISDSVSIVGANRGATKIIQSSGNAAAFQWVPSSRRCCRTSPSNTRHQPPLPQTLHRPPSLPRPRKRPHPHLTSIGPSVKDAMPRVSWIVAVGR